jgi:hypothetical protein
MESKRFVEKETWRKLLGSLPDESGPGLAIFWRGNQDGRYFKMNDASLCSE